MPKLYIQIKNVSSNSILDKNSDCLQEIYPLLKKGSIAYSLIIPEGVIAISEKNFLQLHKPRFCKNF